MRTHIENAWNKAIAAKAWWDEGPPDPVYDKNVRVQNDNSLGYIVAAIGIVWLIAQIGPVVELVTR